MKFKKFLAVLCVALLFSMIIAPINVSARTKESIVLKSPIFADVDADSWDRGEGNPEYVVDGKKTTLWHSLWDIAAAEKAGVEEPESAEGDYPQILIVEFDGIHEIDCIGYLNRNYSGSRNGTVLQYEFWATETGSVADLHVDDGWTMIASGEWDEDDEQFENQEFRNVKFAATKTKAIKFKVLDGVSGWASCAQLEFNFLDVDDYVPMEGFDPSAVEPWKPKNFRINDGTTIITAIDFDAGADNYNKNPNSDSKVMRPDEDVNTEVGESEFGGNIGWINAGEWVQYTARFDEGKYKIDAWLATDAGEPGGVTVYIDGVETGTSDTPNKNGWQAYELYAVGETEVTAGSHVIKVEFNGGCNFSALEVTRTGDIEKPADEIPAEDVLEDGDTPAEGENNENSASTSADESEGPDMILWIVLGAAAVIIIVIIVIIVTKKKK